MLAGLWLGGCSYSRTLPTPVAITNRPSWPAFGAGPGAPSYSGNTHGPGDTKFRPESANFNIPNHNPWKPNVDERDWEYIVIHHTATSSGNVEQINQEHLHRTDAHGNHWLGIGYHFVIGNGDGMPDGQIEPTFRWNQQLQGAHAGVEAYNQRGIGISLVGNFEETSPTVGQLASVKRLVAILAAEYGILPENIVGHGDITATACPGRLFPMAEVRQSVALSLRHRNASGKTSLGLTTWEGSRRR